MEEVEYMPTAAERAGRELAVGDAETVHWAPGVFGRASAVAVHLHGVRILTHRYARALV